MRELIGVGQEKPEVFTLLGAIGSVCFVILNIVFSFMALYEYKHSPDHPRRAVVGSGVMILLAVLNVLSWILVVTDSLSMKNPPSLSIVLFDLTLLVYWWTSPSEKWKRRRTTRQGFLVMALLSAILIIACVLIFV